MSTLPTSSGVYVITCAANGKIYVGATNNLRRRKQRHFTDLRTGCHKNPILQIAWNEHGEATFTFKVVELCASEDVIEREKHYINTLKPFDPKGFNIKGSGKVTNFKRKPTPEQRAQTGLRYSKAYIVTSPEGTQTHIVNLRKFCREHGLDHSTMSAVANGKAHYHKGWKCAHVKEDVEQS